MFGLPLLPLLLLFFEAIVFTWLLFHHYNCCCGIVIVNIQPQTLPRPLPFAPANYLFSFQLSFEATYTFRMRKTRW